MNRASLDSLPPLRVVLNQYDLMAKKSLGQHFLCDLNLTHKIVRLAGALEGMTVFEIGPGPGGLTRALLASGAEKVIVIEKDPRCRAALDEIAAVVGDRLEIHEADALQLNLLPLAPPPRAIVANLPYNIATELLMGWLENIDAFESLTLMFQAEVVDRLLAKPNSKDYGRLSVITQFCCEGKRVLDIPPEAFTPPPKVRSAVVRLTPRKDRAADISLKNLARVTQAAFGQRRKMLRSSLKSLGGEALLRAASLDPSQRAENLSVQDFETLTRLLQKEQLK